MRNKRNQAGFTLVELSIVLVIISLIVGGVLVGQDMIRSAELRSAITQIESFSTAANTFRTKFDGLPGDLSNNKAVRFDFTAASTPGTNGHRDGDGLIEGCSASAAVYGCEAGLFWNDLSLAQMVAEEFSDANAASIGDGGSLLEDLLPTSDVGRGHYITIFTDNGRNWFRLGEITDINDTTGVYTIGNSLPPQIAFNLDEKIDDANPTRGSTTAAYMTAAAALDADFAVTDNDAATNSAGAYTDCAYDADTTASVLRTEYNVGLTGGANETPSCQLTIRASF